MTGYMIERRYGASNCDWLAEITGVSTVWSGVPNAVIFSSKRTARHALAAARRLMRRCDGGERFSLALIHDRRHLAPSVASNEVAPRPRSGSWSQFELRFHPIDNADGSLMWEWADLPQPLDVHRLWTVTDCDGRLCLATGLHYVNRIGYVRTEVAWTSADELRAWRYD